MGAEESDRMLRLVGRPGKYAWLVCFFLWPHYYQIAFNHLAMSIYGARPPHHCRLPDGIAVDNTTIPEINGVRDSCKVYANYTHLSDETIPCPDGWVYTLAEKESTIVNEWDLVCDQKYLPSLATTIYFTGVMVGGLVCGSIADFTGRYPMLIITAYVPVILGVMVYLVENITLFIVLRFFIGILEQGLQLAVFVLVIEHSVNTKSRAIINGIFELSWSIGVMLLALIAYIFKDWRNIQLGISLPVLLSLVTIWFIPESLRWQINKGKFREALVYLKRAARFNKVTLPEYVKDDLQNICENNIRLDEVTEREKKHTLFDGFRTPNIRKNMLVMFFVWFGNSMVYYGLSFQASRLSGDKYLNFFISGAVEFPAYAIGIGLNMKVGRRIPLIVYFMIAGTACILAGVIPKETGSGTDIAWVSTMLAWIGKFSSAGVWSIIFLFASEIFPTVIRNAGVGGCAFWARVGALVAPQINLIADYSHSWIPIIIYGLMALLAGFLSLLLPETRNNALPDTFEEAENLGKDVEKQTIEGTTAAHNNENGSPQENELPQNNGLSRENGLQDNGHDNEVFTTL